MIKKCTKFIILIGVCIVSASCVESDPPTAISDWEVAENQDFNFSIEYPTNFSMQLAGESGYKGGHDIRFITWEAGPQRPKHLSITVEMRPLENSTLNDVIEWGNEDLDSIKANPVELVNAGLEEFFLKEDLIGNTKVFRRRYAFRKAELMYEEVYISRPDDMVIISMRVSEADFEYSLKIFNQMVESFEPLE